MRCLAFNELAASFALMAPQKSFFLTLQVRPTQAASVNNRFRCVREVAEGGQRFLELDTGEGWAFDKANSWVLR